MVSAQALVGSSSAHLTSTRASPRSKMKWAAFEGGGGGGRGPVGAAGTAGRRRGRGRRVGLRTGARPARGRRGLGHGGRAEEQGRGPGETEQTLHGMSLGSARRATRHRNAWRLRRFGAGPAAGRTTPR